MTVDRTAWLVEIVGYCLIAWVLSHWMGWWVVPLGAGFGLVRGSTA